MKYSSTVLEDLRIEVSGRVSKKRFSHILGVERCAVSLGKIFLPDNVDELAAAALLHDVTKEIPTDSQIKMLEESGFDLTEEDKSTEGVLHSFTAPIVIKRDFPQFATKNVLLAVGNHTVGRENMSVFEKIIFISDYAEDTRCYESCKEVRRALFEGIEDLKGDDLIKRLDTAMLMSVDGALSALDRMGQRINSRMYLTRKSLTMNNLQT